MLVARMHQIAYCNLKNFWDDEHANKVASGCFHHIRRLLKQIRRLVGPDITAILVSAFVLSKLDYCNAILARLPKATIAPLHAAARLIACL